MDVGLIYVRLLRRKKKDAESNTLTVWAARRSEEEAVCSDWW